MHLPVVQSSAFLYTPSFSIHADVRGMIAGIFRANGETVPWQWFTRRRVKGEINTWLTGVAPRRFAEAADFLQTVGAAGNPSHLLQRRTPLGIYSFRQTGFWRQADMAVITSNGPSGRLSFLADSLAVKLPLSWCDECVSEERAQKLLPTWRTLHFLPFLYHCPFHRTLLRACCATCGWERNPVSLHLLPTDSCEQCGSASFECAEGFSDFQSPGYWGVLNLTLGVWQRKVDLEALDRSHDYRRFDWRAKIGEAVSKRWERFELHRVQSAAEGDGEHSQGALGSVYNGRLLNALITADAALSSGLVCEDDLRFRLCQP